MANSIKSLTVRDFLGPIGQFITNLLGKNGLLWWEAFKRFLKKKMVLFPHDSAFDPNWDSQSKWELLVLDSDMGPVAIQGLLYAKRLRMGTTVELISVASLPELYRNSAYSVAVLTHFRSRGSKPCAVFATKGECGEFSLKIANNPETAVWRAGLNFLVFPEKE
jgi:hypothetical protein